MGSATTQALAATTAALDAAAGVDLDRARELFAAARIVGDSPQLSGALADSSASAEAPCPGGRRRVRRGASAPTTRVAADDGRRAAVVVVRPTSSTAIEELAVRAAARLRATAPTSRASCSRFSRTVAANPELELALGSRLGDAAAKGALVETLLEGRASAATSLIVVVARAAAARAPRRQLLVHAMDARRRPARPHRRHGRLGRSAERRAVGATQRGARASATARTSTLNAVVDPSVVGGLRVQIADDVIDASVSSRLADLRQRLAG